MKYFLKLSIISLLFTSCLTDSKDELKQQNYEIVVNGFNVKTSGHTQSIYTNQDVFNYAQRNDYNMMNLLNSTVEISSENLEINELDICEIKLGIPPSKGSGSLTSSSRIITAYHVVQSSLDGIFNIYFDGYEFNRRGRLYFDKHLVTNPPLRYENPLLAKRLFSLGLDQWAEFNKNHISMANDNGSDIRPLLRGWKFEWDERENQPFIKLKSTPNNYEGRDLALLKAIPHVILNSLDKDREQIEDEENIHYLRSGGYEINHPGPYFTIASVGDFRENHEDVCQFKKDEQLREVYGTHNNLYPFTEAQEKLPIYSTGYLEVPSIEHDGSPSKDRCEVKNGQNIIVNIDYKHCIKTTLDVIGGSSGGGLYDEGCRYEGDGNYGENVPQYLWLKSVTQSIAWGGSQINPDPVTQNRRWNDGIYHDYSPHEYGQQELNDVYSMYTMLGFEGARWARRDTSYDLNQPNPFKPIPNQPAEDGCPGDGTRPNCTVQLSWSNSTGYDPVGNFSPEPYELTSQGANPVEQNKNAFNDIEKRLAQEGNYEFLPCEDSRQPASRQLQLTENGQKPNLRFGMVQGFTGSLNKLWLDTSDQTIRVDALAPVCVPWSSSTWLDNWSWTKVTTFRQSSGFRLAAALKPVFLDYATKHISEYLGTFYERRRLSPTGSAEVVHPPSFKTCPPNYYLNGVSYWKTPKTHELVGLKELICEVHRTAYEQAPSDAKPPLELRVPLAASTLHEGFFFDTPNKPKSFDLSANIGLIRPPSGQAWAELAQDRCPERQVVVAAVLKRPPTLNAQDNQPLDYFHLYCARAPRGGKP